jgi:tetratricopeptide (TPR) repeat protein
MRNHTPFFAFLAQLNVVRPFCVCTSLKGGAMSNQLRVMFGLPTLEEPLPSVDSVLGSEDVEAHFGLASTYWSYAMPAEAIAILENAVIQFPKIAKLHRLLGANYEVTGNMEASIRHLTEATRLDPNDEYAANGLGNAYLAAGRVPEALEQWERTLALRQKQIDAGVKHPLSINTGVAASARKSLERSVEPPMGLG